MHASGPLRPYRNRPTKRPPSPPFTARTFESPLGVFRSWYCSFGGVRSLGLWALDNSESKMALETGFAYCPSRTKPRLHLTLTSKRTYF